MATARQSVAVTAVVYQERLDSPAPARQPSVTAGQYIVGRAEHQLRSRLEGLREASLYALHLRHTVLASRSLGRATGLPPISGGGRCDSVRSDA